MQQLLQMLTYKRPHQSATEAAFIAKFIEPLAQHPQVIDYYCDEIGNVFVTTHPASKTLFTAHVDTVHSKDGMQVVTHDANINLIYLDDKAALATNCLGADDTAGMWLMLQMIDAGVPGTFAFFRGEERGGIGSRHAAQHNADFFKQFDRAIAFDRRGTGDVITHQAGGRCCSDEFASALADQLCAHNVTYAPCNGGVFTDTANLTDLIGECTNLSCGYDMEHSVNETLDAEHLLHMRDALVSIDWEGLPTKRGKGEVDPDEYNYNSWGSFSSYSFPDTEKVTRMKYTELVKWVRKSSVEDIAEVIYDLIDQIDMVQDEMLDYRDEAAYDTYYKQAGG
jgi:Peptidase family M28